MNIGKIIDGEKIIIFETEKAIVYKYIRGYYDRVDVENFESEEEKNRYIKEWSEDE